MAVEEKLQNSENMFVEIIFWDCREPTSVVITIGSHGFHLQVAQVLV